MAYPEWFKSFVQVNLWPGLDASLLTSQGGQAGFMLASEELEVPEHAHQGQWGIVVEGVVELTIGRVLHVLRKGDNYYIPAGVPHSAKLHKGAMFIDVWEGVRVPVPAEGQS